MNDFETLLRKTGEIGTVTQVMDAIVYAQGLPGAKPDEIIIFETGEKGQVLSLLADAIEILTFSQNKIRVGTRIARTNSPMKMPVGEALLGQVIDPFGNPLSTNDKAKNLDIFLPVDNEPRGITDRKGIKKYLETGTSIVDLMIPLGRGQKELIIGDRKIGKTNFLLHAILTQARQGNICIYSFIGKRKIDIKQAEEYFKANNIMENVIIIGSTSTDPAGLIYLTPYSAMALAEYFRNQGKDVLLVLDDMLTHARFYREISLLGKRFPGRNSYPGDIFYVHAKLLERAGNFVTKTGEAAITCLPVVETTQGDLSGYIQTNLMSMTDGHLFFDSNLFYQGRRPAVNPFLSVTRVGRQTQSDVKRSINRELTSFLTLYEKIQTFVHFGSELSQSARITLDTGKRIIHLFHQPLNETIPADVQTIFFVLIWGGLFNNHNMEDVLAKRKKMTEIYLGSGKTQVDLNGYIESAATFNQLLEKVKKLDPFINSIINL